MSTPSSIDSDAAAQPRGGLAHKLHICAVWSRSYDDPALGRAKTVRAIRAALERHEVLHCTMHSRLEHGRVRGVMCILADLAMSLIRGRTAALQVLLYGDRSEIRRICRTIEVSAPEIVLIDSVRLLPLLREVRKRWPDIGIVVDMDDLFSERYGHLAESCSSLNLGYISQLVPKGIAGLLGNRDATRLLYRHEARALQTDECEAAALSDAVVLVSAAETATLRGRITGRHSVHTMVPPPPAVRVNPAPAKPPFHFVFIGTDKLEQNSATIAFLLDLWRENALAKDLVIHGKMSRSWDTPLRVRFAGFAPDLGKVYSPGAILLAPSFTKGGIKTKVVEAFGYGVPVIGTPTTFRGLVDDYPLSVATPSELPEMLRNIDAAVDVVRRAQQQGYRFAVEHDAAAYGRRWDEILWSSARRRVTTGGQI